MVACNARPGPMVLSFLIYRLQIKIPAGTVAAIVATIAVCQPIFLDRQLGIGIKRGKTCRDHGPLYHASGRQSRHLWEWWMSCLSAYSMSLVEKWLTQQQSRAIRPWYTKHPSLNMPTYSSASDFSIYRRPIGLGDLRPITLRTHTPPPEPYTQPTSRTNLCSPLLYLPTTIYYRLSTAFPKIITSS
jgi:hypothetical protein